MEKVCAKKIVTTDGILSKACVLEEARCCAGGDCRASLCELSSAARILRPNAKACCDASQILNPTKRSRLERCEAANVVQEPPKRESCDK